MNGSASPRGILSYKLRPQTLSGAKRRIRERLVFARKFSRRTLFAGAIGIAFVMALSTVMLLRTGRGPVVQAVPFSDLLRQLDRGAVAEVVVSGDALDFKLTSGELFRTVAPANYVTANAAFVPELVKRNVRIDIRTVSEQSAYSYGALCSRAPGCGRT